MFARRAFETRFMARKGSMGRSLFVLHAILHKLIYRIFYGVRLLEPQDFHAGYACRFPAVTLAYALWHLHARLKTATPAGLHLMLPDAPFEKLQQCANFG